MLDDETVRGYRSTAEDRVVSSGQTICEHYFPYRTLLSEISFESDSKLSRIEHQALFRGGIKSIHIPRSLELICHTWFCSCESLTSISLKAGIQKLPFSSMALKSLNLSVSIVRISEKCFSCRKSPDSILLDSQTKLSQISVVGSVRIHSTANLLRIEHQAFSPSWIESFDIPCFR
jgi:hypothetical protein